MNSARNFREYKVWQDAVAYATLVYEVETQLIISRNVGYITPEQETALIAENQRIQKQLIALIRNIRQSK